MQTVIGCRATNVADVYVSCAARPTFSSSFKQLCIYFKALQTSMSLQLQLLGLTIRMSHVTTPLQTETELLLLEETARSCRGLLQNLPTPARLLARYQAKYFWS